VDADVDAVRGQGTHLGQRVLSEAAVYAERRLVADGGGQARLYAARLRRADKDHDGAARGAWLAPCRAARFIE
jgi:hypothetical protein